MTEELKSASDIKKENLSPDSNAAAIEAPAGKSGAFASLRLPNFRLLLSGSVLSYANQWIQSVVLGWLVYDLTGSGTILGTINLVSSIASLGMLFATGLLVDYYNRRKLMLISSGGFLALTLSLGLVLLTGHANIIYLFVFATIYGSVEILDSTVRQVVVFDLVPRSQTPSAMALIQTGWSVMRVVGPSLGGFLILWLTAGGSFLLMAGVCAVIAITVIYMKLAPRTPEAVRSSPLQNIQEGLSYLFREPVTRIFTLIGIVMPILAVPIFATLPPIYAVHVFHDNSGKVLGFLVAAVGVGGVIGGVVTAYMKRWEHWGWLQMASLFLLSVSLIGFAYTSTLPLDLGILVFAGFFEIIFLTTNMTLIQLSIPDKLRGRVTAAVNLTWILSPIGSLIAGAGADWLGPKEITIILAGVAAGLVVLVLAFSPTVRNYRLSRSIKANSGSPSSVSNEG